MIKISSPEAGVENLAHAIAELGTIAVRLERHHGTLTGRTWLELNGEGRLSHDLGYALHSSPESHKPVVERVLSEHMDSLLQRSVDAASDPENAAILQNELSSFQQGKPIYFRLQTYPYPGRDADCGIPFSIRKPALP